MQNGFAQVGITSEVIDDPSRAHLFDRLVLPGVGAFPDAVATLKAKGWDQAVIGHINTGRPLLGICLGLQMLFEVGYEDGEHRGLGVIPGKCIRFDVDTAYGLKVPHMGWNQLNVVRPCPLYRGIEPGSGVYFVHSYHVEPTDSGTWWRRRRSMGGSLCRASGERT